MGRTLQIATRIQPSMKLKFVFNETYSYRPNVQCGLGSKQEMMLIGFSANTVSSIHCNAMLAGNSNVNLMWQMQSPGGVHGINSTPDAAGFTEWKDRYTYGTVIGSKITVSAKTTTQAQGEHEPLLMFIHKTGTESPQNVFSTSSGADNVNDKAYISKALIMSSNVSTGATIKQGYSGRKFEGVSGSIINKESYRFAFHPYEAPEEESSWILGFCNARGRDRQPIVGPTPGVAGANLTPGLLVQVKIEYIVVMSEPKTGYNPPPMPPGVGTQTG